MQTVDLGGGRGWAAPDAGASILRVDAQLGRELQITEAGRSYKRQAELRADWEQGKPGAAFALPPDPPEGPSEHQSGEAIDTDEWVNSTVVRVLNDNGWHQTAIKRGEPWHFDYFRDRDNHLEDDMPTPEQIARAVVETMISDAKDPARAYALGVRLREANASLDRIEERVKIIEGDVRKTFDAVTPGVQGVKHDGALYSLVKHLTIEGINPEDVAAAIIDAGVGDAVADALAKRLA